MSKVMPVYVEEALTGSQGLTMECRGAYWTLLFKLWSCDGRLKDDIHMISRVLGTTTRCWKRIRSELIDAGKLDIVDGMIINRKLERTQLQVAKKSETLRKNRETRWSKSLKTNNTGVKSLSVIEDNKIKDNIRGGAKAPHMRPIDYTKDFEIFYKAYPKRVGRGQAVKAYEKSRKEGASADQILNGAVAYAAACTETDKQYIRHPSTWLNGQGWLDELEAKPVRELDEAGPLAPKTYTKEELTL